MAFKPYILLRSYYRGSRNAYRSTLHLKRESDKKWFESKKFKFASIALLAIFIIYFDTMHCATVDKVTVAMPLLMKLVDFLSTMALSCLGIYGVAQGLEKWNEKPSYLKLDPKDLDNTDVK